MLRARTTLRPWRGSVGVSYTLLARKLCQNKSLKWEATAAAGPRGLYLHRWCDRDTSVTAHPTITRDGKELRIPYLSLFHGDTMRHSLLSHRHLVREFRGRARENKREKD